MRLNKSLLAACFLGACSLPLQAEEEFIVGATTHFGQGKGMLLENLSVFKQGGMNSTRDEIYWGGCEREKGKIEIPAWAGNYIDAAKKAGVRPLTILDYGNSLYEESGYPKAPESIEAFAKYAETVVKAFKGKAELYQVWNEWDGGCGMNAKFRGQGTPEAYVKLLAAVYPRIKAANPNAIVIANSVCTGDKTFKATLDAGLLKHCDIACLHTYNYNEGENATPEKWLERMEGVRKALQEHNDGKDFPLAITEMGWPNHVAGGGRPDEESADYICRLYLLAKTMPFIKGIWYYDFQNDGWNARDNENNFGLVKSDLTPKAPFAALKDLAPLIRKGRFVEKIASPDENVVGLRFKTGDGKDALAFWSTAKDDDFQITLSSEKGVSEEFQQLYPGKVSLQRKFEARDWTAGGRNAKENAREFQFVVRGRPCVLTGALPDVKIAKVERKSFPEATRPGKNVIVVPDAIAKALKLGSASAQKALNFGADSCYRQILQPRKDRKDLDGSFSIQWTKDALFLNVNVTDDVHAQDWTEDETWQGDGLQFAFQLFGRNPGDFLGHSDFDAALTKQGPFVYRQAAQGDLFKKGEAKDVEAKIVREGQTTKYELKIPAKSIGAKEFKPGFVFGFSLLVNDNDGGGRKGYLHWGDGIGHAKDPSEYNWIMLEE